MFEIFLDSVKINSYNKAKSGRLFVELGLTGGTTLDVNSENGSLDEIVIKYEMLPFSCTLVFTPVKWGSNQHLICEQLKNVKALAQMVK